MIHKLQIKWWFLTLKEFFGFFFVLLNDFKNTVKSYALIRT